MDQSGKTVDVGKRAERMAKYLAEVQWKKPKKPETIQNETRNRRQIISTHLGIHTEPFEMQEMERVIKTFRNNKAPGPNNKKQNT